MRFFAKREKSPKIRDFQKKIANFSDFCAAAQKSIEISRGDARNLSIFRENREKSMVFALRRKNHVKFRAAARNFTKNAHKRAFFGRFFAKREKSRKISRCCVKF